MNKVVAHSKRNDLVLAGFTDYEGQETHLWRYVSFYLNEEDHRPFLSLHRNDWELTITANNADAPIGTVFRHPGQEYVIYVKKGENDYAQFVAAKNGQSIRITTNFYASQIKLNEMEIV